MGPEDVSKVKNNICAIQSTRGKGVNKIQLSKIWVVSEELASKDIDKNSQLCKHHADNSLSQQSSTNNIESRGSHIRCSGLEPHHPIMSKLWNLGGQNQRKKKEYYGS